MAMNKSDADKVYTVGHLVSKLMRPMFVYNMALGMIHHDGPLGKSARTRAINASQEIDTAVREYVKLHPEE